MADAYKNAMHWYGQAYDATRSLFPAINMCTLMTAYGVSNDQFEVRHSLIIPAHMTRIPNIADARRSTVFFVRPGPGDCQGLLDHCVHA